MAGNGITVAVGVWLCLRMEAWPWVLGSAGLRGAVAVSVRKWPRGLDVEGGHCFIEGWMHGCRRFETDFKYVVWMKVKWI